MRKRLFIWVLGATFFALMLMWIREATIYFYDGGFRFYHAPWLELSIGNSSLYMTDVWGIKLEDGDGLPGNKMEVPLSKTSRVSLRWWSARWHQEHYGE